MNENFRSLFAGFGDGASRLAPLPAAKKETQMPGAAFAAAERPQEQERQDGPFQHAMPVRADDILVPAQRALARAHPKRNCVRFDHEYQYIAVR